ncbi:hypothetical protein PRUPE_2G066900 [Prunus persica]|uniref:Uncharacterized protein n=1 Tax=Prunus persica TaxID=3760 RepID=A0A251QCC1_PRUPE|nr:hypothetical protein PRUPE_2G066900 [Prunus persica]
MLAPTSLEISFNTCLEVSSGDLDLVQILLPLGTTFSIVLTVLEDKEGSNPSLFTSLPKSSPTCLKASNLDPLEVPLAFLPLPSLKLVLNFLLG